MDILVIVAIELGSKLKTKMDGNYIDISCQCLQSGAKFYWHMNQLVPPMASTLKEKSKDSPVQPTKKVKQATINGPPKKKLKVYSKLAQVEDL